MTFCMKRLFPIVILVALGTRGGLAQPPRVPVLVELYTSEGCSSCPPADVLLESLQREQPIAGADVIPIGLHVDYFDHLGWKDAFSSSAFTARQQSYSSVFGGDNLYTPQMVIDGEKAVPGVDAVHIRDAIKEAAGRPHLPLRLAVRVTTGNAQLTIDRPAAPSHAEKIQVLAAITEDDLSSTVTRGENHGRTLHHVAVARTIHVLSALSERPSTEEKVVPIRKEWGANLNAVVWLQGMRSREVYGSATIRITR
jgi:hypothetical protein